MDWDGEQRSNFCQEQAKRHTRVESHAGHTVPRSFAHHQANLLLQLSNYHLIAKSKASYHTLRLRWTERAKPICKFRAVCLGRLLFQDLPRRSEFHRLRIRHKWESTVSQQATTCTSVLYVCCYVACCTASQFRLIPPSPRGTAVDSSGFPIGEQIIGPTNMKPRCMSKIMQSFKSTERLRSSGIIWDTRHIYILYVANCKDRMPAETLKKI